MNDKLNINNNIKNAKTQNNVNNFSNKINFLTESEIIINYIIEKLISLSITESIKNKIDKFLPNFCYNQIYDSLILLNQLEFITYDKDDFYPINKKNLQKIKSSNNLNNSIYSIIPSKIEEINNSEIIRKYKFDNKYDPNISNEISIDLSLLEHSEKEDKDGKTEKDANEMKDEHDKIILGILNREGYEDKNNSFQIETAKKEKLIQKYNKKTNYNFSENKKEIIKEIYSKQENGNEPFHINPEEKIDEIQNVEIHKIDILKSKFSNTISTNNKKNKKKSIPYEKVIESKNFWNPILEPLTAPIDRDAGTKIKYAGPKIKLNKKMLSKQIILDDNIDTNITEKKLLTENNKEIISSKKSKKIKYDYGLKTAQNNKKKKIAFIPFDSSDIDPEKLETYKELEEISSLRNGLEKALQEKKKEKEILAKIEKEKKSKMEALEEIRKELYRKNVTVDVKGEIVYIKPIDIKGLMEEFNNGKGNFKNIKILETETSYLKKNTPIKVEKNPLANYEPELKEEKSKKNKKKKLINFFQKGLNIASISSKNINKNIGAIDKSMKYVSGSNFGIINPEVGVNIIENKAVKSGGKDFYKKYNRFSIEVFQEQLSKTSNSFFPKLSEPNDMNTNDIINNRRPSSNMKDKISKIMDYKNKGKINEKKRNRNINEKNSLSLKTKNLKIALQDLDLITETEITDLNRKKKFTKSNFLQKILDNSNSHTRNNNLNDMNKFAKALMAKENWGISNTYTEREKYNNYKIPKKPESLDIKRELPNNMFKHMPRRRLPPINISIKMNTLTEFFTSRKSKKVKEFKTEDKKE